MQWVKKNPLTNAGKDRPLIQRDKDFRTCKQNATNQKCGLCDNMLNKLNDFAKVKDLVKRRQKVSSKKLCFKCPKSGHCIVDGLSRTCLKCNWKHYKSLCINDQLQNNSSKRDLEPKEKTLVSFGENNVCWPIMTFYANEIWQKP